MPDDIKKWTLPCTGSHLDRLFQLFSLVFASLWQQLAGAGQWCSLPSGQWDCTSVPIHQTQLPFKVTTHFSSCNGSECPPLLLGNKRAQHSSYCSPSVNPNLLQTSGHSCSQIRTGQWLWVKAASHIYTYLNCDRLHIQHPETYISILYVSCICVTYACL